MLDELQGDPLGDNNKIAVRFDLGAQTLKHDAEGFDSRLTSQHFDEHGRRRSDGSRYQLRDRREGRIDAVMMSVYFGSSGCVELQRDSGRSEMLASRLDVVDVNMDRRRFSVDFALGALITGDEIHIYTLITPVSGRRAPRRVSKRINGWFPGELSCGSLG